MSGQGRPIPVVSLAPFYLQSLGRGCHAASCLGHGNCNPQDDAKLRHPVV